MAFVQIDIEQLVEEYESGSSIRYLAKKYGTSKVTITRKLEKGGSHIRNSAEQIHMAWWAHKQSSKPISDLTPELLTELWNTRSISVIAQETGSTITRIKRMARRLQLPEYNPPVWKPQTDWDNYDWLHKHYIIDRLSTNSIASLVGSTPETIKKKLLTHNIQVRSLQEAIGCWNAKPEAKEIRKRAAKKAYVKTKARLEEGKIAYLASLPPVPYKDQEWLRQQHESKNAATIAREQGVHRLTIKYWLIKFGIYDHTKLRRWTPEMIKEMSERSKALWKNNRQRLAIRTEEQKAKIAAAVSSYFADPPDPVKIAEWKAKLSQSVKTLWRCPQYIDANKRSTCYGRVIDYHPLKNEHETIRFRSQLECAYAIMLDLDEEILYWDYEVDRITYGDDRTYIIDFTVQSIDAIEYIEVKPIKFQIKIDKYMAAEESLPWRFTTAAELNLATHLFKNGYLYDNVIFVNLWPKNSPAYVAWSKQRTIQRDGWRLSETKRYGVYFRHKMITTT